MTDLEMTKLCAQAMGWRSAGERKDFDTVKAIPVEQFPGAPHYQYAPLHDDSAVMALVKKYGLSISGPTPKDKDREFYVWCAFEAKFRGSLGQSKDLNRAIVECVAKMQAAKVAA